MERKLLLGGDISELGYLEECGTKYYDRNGAKKDAIRIFAESGMNLVRIRNYNHPGKGRGWTDPKTGITYYRRENTGSLADNLALMKRAKDAGMQIEFSFHYSDYWTNGWTQIIPQEWRRQLEQEMVSEGAGETTEQAVACLERLVYEYTKESLLKMKEQDTLPEYISLGNEIQSGMLYPYGAYPASHVAIEVGMMTEELRRAVQEKGSFSHLARFLNAGARAVREIAPECRIITHLDGAGELYKYLDFFGKCEALKVDYDIIGVSYYPNGGRSVEEVVTFLNELVERFERDIMIMETGYCFTPELPGGVPGQLATCGPYDKGEGASKKGQKLFMQELILGMKQVKDGRCIGDIYWDPIMVEQPGVGWAVIDEGDGIAAHDTVTDNIVSNTTLFDFAHRALPALTVYQQK